MTVVHPWRVADDIAVAVATMDRPERLARCIDAILSQAVRPAEIIVVDQSADDESEPVVEERRAEFAQLHYCRQRRLGLSASRNQAIAMATRPIIVVTDDDCVPGDEWVAAIERAFQDPSAPDAVSGRVLPLGPDRPGYFAVSSRRSTEAHEFSGRVLPWHVGTGANFAVRRTLLARSGLYDERLGAGSRGLAAEDIDFVYRLLRAGATIRFDPDVVVYHDRADASRRALTRRTYSFGIGVFCGLWLRQKDLYAARMFASWIYQAAWKTASMVRRHQWLQARWYAAGMVSAIAGLVKGLATPPVGSVGDEQSIGRA